MTQDAHRLDDCDSEARDWLGRLQAGENSDRTRAEFEAWLNASPAHRAAFERVHALWSLIGKSDRIETWANELESSSVAADTKRSTQPLVTTRRIAIGAAFAAGVALVLSLAGLYPSHPEPQRFVSAIAETKTVSLADGTVLTLAGSSEVKVAFTDEVRSVELVRGSVFFDVERNADWPMTVTAADTQVHVVGTAFGVRYGSRDIRVAVTKGKVRVTGAAASADVALVAGQQATSDLRGRVIAQGAADIEGELAWIKGRFVYDGARLIDVIDDINRYRVKKIEVASGQVADIRITTSFGVDQIDPFLAGLPLAYPVRITESLDKTLIDPQR